MQRQSGAFDKKFRDYSTVAIGIYCKAAAIDLATCLTIEDAYAKLFSKFRAE